MTHCHPGGSGVPRSRRTPNATDSEQRSPHLPDCPTRRRNSAPAPYQGTASAAEVTYSNFSASSSCRGVLTAFGEPEIKTFVRASIDEALKLGCPILRGFRRAGPQLRRGSASCSHYSPIIATVDGEAPEI